MSAFCPHTCAKTSMPLVNCIVNGQCHAKHATNAASVTTLNKIVCYLQRIFDRNRKLKQQINKLIGLKLDLCSKNQCILGYISLAFSSGFAKIRTSNFCKVVRQHSKGVVENIMWFCWKFRSFSNGLKLLQELTKLCQA